MFRLTHLAALPGYRLHLQYEDGVNGNVDLSHLVGKGVFQLRTLFRQCVSCGASLALAFAGALLGAGEIREIPDTANSGSDVLPGLRRVAVAGAQASSAFAPESGQYAPDRAVDGNRGTKWVASVAPSPDAPQWITLDFFGAQEVSAVAVFGERIDNDGILEARIEVTRAQANQFTMVATIPDAKAAHWLATFDPVKATSVRLSIVRSGGPSPHTDVYEIEVFGSPLSAEELQRFAGERLNGCEVQRKRLSEASEKLGLNTDPQFAGLRAAVDAIDQQHRQISARYTRWDTLDVAGWQSVVDESERLEMRIQRLIPGLERAAAVWPERARDLATARQAALATHAGKEVTSVRENGTLRIGNNRISVVLDEADGVWGATWLGAADAGVRRVGFAIQADGATLVPTEATTETAPVSDAIGHGQELRQRWGTGIEVKRCLRLYDGKPVVVVSGQIANNTDHDVQLNTIKMLELSADDHGWWHLADALQAPAAVGFSGASPPCRPAPDEGALSETSQRYSSGGVLALAPRVACAAMAIGFLSSHEGSPQVDAQFQAGNGGISLGATLALGGRMLPAGQTISLDGVWLSVEENQFDALERYGDAAATLAREPVRTGANALWCSWYPIRMGINEEIVLAHAAIAAEHFKPLGLDVIQLDHGWQRGDICGDWVPNERFPHGFQWLSEQLRTHYGMKLGLWIAPTQVAFTSQLFQDHPEWLMKNADGQPASVGRWYWVPNPDMGVLDASNAEAEQWIEDTFARLSAEGASYYKIDFIGGSPALGRAMAAIRRGAGPDAWIRFCQTPPLLSAGLASSAYIGDDTGDAGLRDWFNLERRNAPLLAASYWANDRLYHREVCDMSVGMKADVEEARFRLTLMTLSGCSISFSDDFRPLELPRIRMMQQCLPPGNPPARPLDLFQRELPSLWHMHCTNEADQWDAVGVFNFEDQPQERTVDLAALGVPADTEVVAFEFWEEKYLGAHTGHITLSLAPRTARILLIHRRPAHPQLIATNLHVLGGYHEVKQWVWNEQQSLLSGRYQRAPGLAGKAYLYIPDGYRPRLDAASTRGSVRLTHTHDNLWTQEIQFQEANLDWTIAFARTAP